MAGGLDPPIVPVADGQGPARRRGRPPTVVTEEVLEQRRLSKQHLNAQRPEIHSPAMDSDRSSGEYDVHIITSGGLRIPTHASVLASASPVLESIMDSPGNHRSSENTIQILGMPNDAVSVFVGFPFFSASRCSEEENGEIWDSFTSSVSCVLSTTAEAKVHQGIGSMIDN